MRFIPVFVIVLILGIGVFWYFTDISPERKTAVSETFTRENTVTLPDTTYTNAEIVTLPDGRYRMYFHNIDGIMSAISMDGKTFTLEDGVRLSSGIMSATIALSEGGYRMYYTSVPDKNLRSATSDDGLTFTPESGIRLAKGNAFSLDMNGILHSHVVRLPDETYKLYYDGEGKNDTKEIHWRILSATSTDGVNWTKDKGARIPVDVDPNDDGNRDDEREIDTLEQYKFEMATSPFVTLENGTYVMYFGSQGEPMSQSGIWRATSTDGVNFSVESTPILSRDPAFGNEADYESQGGPKGVPQDPFIITTPGGDRLFFWTSDKGYQSAI